jgi:uncharacterized SAM-binding protein YcdF (DUF218 family)
MVHGLEYADLRPNHVVGDVLVVLGEGVVPNTPASAGLGSLSGPMASEFLTVLRLERTTQLPIIISGGQGSFSDGNEALVGRRVLAALGIHDTWIDDRSETTYQNAANTSVILRQHHWTRPILVTSAFHMVQAVEDFRAVGVRVTPYPTGYQTSRRLRWAGSGWLPSINGLDLTTEALQEYLSIAVFRLGIKT